MLGGCSVNATPHTTHASARFALLAGLLAVSTSGPFFKLAHVSAYAAVFWRTLLAGGLALGFAAGTRRLRLHALREHAASLAGAGLLLGGHLLLWVKAFELTDYASNLLLLVVQPLFAALLDLRSGRALPRGAGLSLGLAALGLGLVAGNDVSLGPRALVGDAVSTLGGALIALFYVVARPARSALPLDVFLGATLLVAAALSLPVALLAGVPLLGYSAASWLWLFGLVLVTTLGGHGLMNLAARTLPLFLVNLAIVLEPVVAIGLGAVLFAAKLRLLQVIGGGLLSSAVVLGLRTPRSVTDVPLAID
jgi:drug/metabolite transporter (DMT)-like permease